jgi:ribulose-5-phosphate 4-epimerase/fuculose-1-phosphate aldolase
MSLLTKQQSLNKVKNQQIELADAYKICEKLGLSDLTYTHLSARASDSSFYIYPFGLLFDEVTPDNLLEVSTDGNILQGEEYQYNKTGYIIHGSVYEHKSNVNAIFHLHTPSIVAVSCFKEGLLNLSQWALHFTGKIAYHDYDSLALDKNQQGSKIIEDLGAHPILMMRHHGVLITGSTIQECLFFAYHLEKACQTQCLMGINSKLTLCEISNETANRSNKDLLSFEDNLGKRDFLALQRLINRENV